MRCRWFLLLAVLCAWGRAADAYIDTPVAVCNQVRTSSGTTMSCAPGSTIAAGTRVWIAITTTNGNGAVTMGDSVDGTTNYCNGSAYDLDVSNASGQRITVCSKNIGSAVTSGDTFNASFPTVTCAAMTVLADTGIASGGPDRTVGATGTSQTADSTTTATLSQAQAIVLGFVGANMGTQTYTTNEGVLIGTNGTSGCATDRQIKPSWRIVNATTGVKTSGSIGGGVNKVWAAGVAAYLDDLINTPTATPTRTPTITSTPTVTATPTVTPTPIPVPAVQMLL